MNGLKKSAKNRGSQWYAQSALCAHTGRVKGKCGSPDAPRAVHPIHIWPQWAGYCIDKVMNGLKKSAKNRESQWYALSALCAHTGRVTGKFGFSGWS